MLVVANSQPYFHLCCVEKQEDDEMVLQVVYLFHYLILHEATREQVTKNSCILIYYTYKVVHRY